MTPYPKYRTIANHSFGMKSITPFLTSSNPQLTRSTYRCKTKKEAQWPLEIILTHVSKNP